MEYKIENEKVEDFFEVVDDLEKLLTDRISDLHEVMASLLYVLWNLTAGLILILEIISLIWISYWLFTGKWIFEPTFKWILKVDEYINIGTNVSRLITHNVQKYGMHGIKSGILSRYIYS